MATWQERMAWDLEFAGRAERTRKVYLADARAFSAFHGCSPEALGQAWRECARRFILFHGERHSNTFPSLM